MTAVPRPAADRAAAYGLEAIVVDGNDAEAVYEMARSRRSPGRGRATVRRSSRRSRTATAATPGPIPASTGRTTRSRRGRPATRSRAQRARLVAAGVDEATLDAIDEETQAKVAEAEAFARAGAEPSPEVIETQVWADGGSSWRSDRA